jgi:FAD/FMN-containing dehydrogenase
MTRFNKTNVNSMSGTVEVGAGLTWDEVYATLGPTGVSVVGGRVPGVGVAGLTLGGGECLPSSESSILLCSYALGYSFLTSQYGLAVDNVAGYELVLPNGTIKDVTSKDDDLWFGLRVSRRAQY